MFLQDLQNCRIYKMNHVNLVNPVILSLVELRLGAIIIRLHSNFTILDINAET